LVALWWRFTPGQAPRLKAALRWGAQLSFSLGLTLILLEGLLQMSVAALPPELVERAVLLERRSQAVQGQMMPPQAPIRHYAWAGQRRQFTFYAADQDLYRVSCLQPPADNPALYEVDIRYTPEGFRREGAGPARLVLAGDSFTAAGWTNQPYWSGLDSEVLAIGIPGSGTWEQALLLEAYLPKEAAQTVILAYFEGNDLQDTQRFAQDWAAYQAGEGDKSVWEQHPQFRPLRFSSAFAAGLWLLDESPLLNQAVYGDCPYPVEDAYGHRLAFYDPYVGMAALSGQEVAASAAFAEVQTAILRARAAAEGVGAWFILLYIPTSFHVHWPGLADSPALLAIAEHTPPMGIGPAGIEARGGVGGEAMADLLRANVGGQRDALAAWAAGEGITFWDLTPELQALAAGGVAVYAEADTHWDNAGHARVGEILRAWLGGEG
jgi:hypothetical protein